MGTKRVGMARVKALINNNINQLSRKFRRVITTTATRDILESESGSTIYMDQGSAHVLTLPTAQAGLNYKFVFKVKSNTAHRINAASGDCFFGKVVLSRTSSKDEAIQQVTYADATGTVTDFNSLHLRGNQATLGSGTGDVIELECIDGTAWRVTANLTTTAAPGTVAVISSAP